MPNSNSFSSHNIDVSVLDFAPDHDVKIESFGRVVFGVSLTLTLSILGSSVLPVPFVFSRMGVLLGLMVTVLVAAANTLTAQLLLNSAQILHHDSYEGLAEAIGGKKAKVVTQLSLALLLFGTLTGAFALLADIGSQALYKLCGEMAPEFLAGHGGRGIMVVLVLLVCTPLMLMRNMRSLEYAAMFGFIPLAVFLVIMVVQATIHGFPAIASGELPLWQIKITGDLPEALAILGYAFYMQPMLLPLLHEMPAGPTGAKAMSYGVRISVMGIATSVYSIAGIFGAARWGSKTAGDCLMNDWITSKWGGLLNLAMAAYLACSAVPVLMSLRYTLDCMVAGEDAPFLLRRHVALTLPPLAVALGLALAYPSNAEKIFAMTGAVPVCLICYIIPVWLHFQLYCRRSRQNGLFDSLKDTEQAAENDLHQPLLADEPSIWYRSRTTAQGVAARVWIITEQVVLPLVVAIAMSVISGMAFWTSVKAFMKETEPH